jgi:lysozyme family protein
MRNNDSSQGEIVAAIGLLVRRRGTTIDPAEKDVISAAIDKLNGDLQALNQAKLLQAMQIVASATDELEKVVGAARLGPFDTFLADIQDAMRRLQARQGQLHESEKLASAEPDASDTPLVAEAPRGAAAASARAAAPVAATGPKAGIVFSDLKAEYAANFQACTPRPQSVQNIDFYVGRLNKFKNAYASAGSDLRIPWYFIGILHAMECGFNFGGHLHNGDPLTARTVHVPAGRPLAGAPPFTWIDSARDALMFQGFQHETEWTLPRVLYLIERYNGMGYRRRGVPSPYLWSFSNIYSKGKFVVDGHFDPNAVSAQCGAAVMLKALQAQGGL